MCTQYDTFSWSEDVSTHFRRGLQPRLRSCAWLLQQLNANRSILVIDEPPMGADKIPENPQDNPLAAAMAQAMMTPMCPRVGCF